jgi:hypothetical protein
MGHRTVIYGPEAIDCFPHQMIQIHWPCLIQICYTNLRKIPINGGFNFKIISGWWFGTGFFIFPVSWEGWVDHQPEIIFP